MITTAIIAVVVICITVLALAWYKDEVSAGMKFFGVALTLEAKNRRRR
jgi:hypothetical protein